LRAQMIADAREAGFDLLRRVRAQPVGRKRGRDQMLAEAAIGKGRTRTFAHELLATAFELGAIDLRAEDARNDVGRLGRHDLDLPVIMVSGHTERARIVAARDAGVNEFIAKPITARNLFLRIAQVVERPRPFVRASSYFGPDRRRQNDAFHVGPWRRQEDRARNVAMV